MEIAMKGNSYMEREMGMGSILMKMEIYMREHGVMILNKEKELSKCLQEMFIKDNGLMGLKMVRDNIPSIMETTIMVLSSEEKGMARDIINGMIKVLMKVNGTRTRWMAMESTSPLII
eukprot:GHVR01184240.1.p2 GENE.GHVR01184240.1~~GHVR01184240.1.p2  ORF type:complete len:118 (-),score=14.03 GHVR01184240.1:2771-3124(-)